MNANEINDLCKPLLDRIGWPEGLVWDGEFSAHLISIDESVYQMIDFNDELGLRFVASLIRCHILDWLHANKCVICLTDAACTMRSESPSDRSVLLIRTDKFPTPLHAVVAAGLKVTEDIHV